MVDQVQEKLVDHSTRMIITHSDLIILVVANATMISVDLCPHIWETICIISHVLTGSKSIAADNDVVGLVGDGDGAQSVHRGVDVVLVDVLLPRLHVYLINILVTLLSLILQDHLLST